MLKSLSVKNFAIIEDLQIDFAPNMTVITGETGAGKSLIIDTISLLLGQRADAEMIRYGEKKAYILGVFSYDNKEISALLRKFGIIETANLTIEREIFNSSKNNIKINGTTVSLLLLKQIAAYLADVHIQNDTFKLFNPDTYLDLLTPQTDEKFAKIMNKYTICYADYLDKLKKYNRVLKGQKEAVEQIEFLEYEKNELEQLNLEVGIDEDLRLEISKLENFDKISMALGGAYENLENEYFSVDQIYTAANNLKKVTGFDDVYQKYYDDLLEAYYNVDEIKTKIKEDLDNLDFDEEELNLKIERLNQIEKAKVKYKKDVSQLLIELEEIKLKLEMVNNYDELLETASSGVLQAFKEVVEVAKNLSNYRQRLAKLIETGIVKECKDLELEDVEFKVTFADINLDDAFNEKVFSEKGIDVVDFLITFNKGEPLKPLHKVASGGEMSRIMLAFKSFFVQQTKLSLMVFDEIDTGVSGITAKKIGEKLLHLADFTQVLCITHLPQVAAMGNQHIHIYKEVSGSRTTTHFKVLDAKERVEEIAMMLSGDKMSLYALNHAKALLENQ